MTEKQPIQYFDALGKSSNSIEFAVKPGTTPTETTQLATDSLAWHLEAEFAILESDLKYLEIPVLEKNARFRIDNITAPNISHLLPILNSAMNGDYAVVLCEIKRRANRYGQFADRSHMRIMQAQLEAVVGNFSEINDPYQLPENTPRLISILGTGGDSL